MSLVKTDADIERLQKHFDHLYKLFTMYFVEAFEATRAAESKLAGSVA
jgi:hypothetical protein